MPVKRRTIWLSDEEWALLGAHAREHKLSVSSVIRDMWQLAADKEPAETDQAKRILAAATKKLGHDPYTTTAVIEDAGIPKFRPVPKPGKKK